MYICTTLILTGIQSISTHIITQPTINILNAIIYETFEHLPISIVRIEYYNFTAG